MERYWSDIKAMFHIETLWNNVLILLSKVWILFLRPGHPCVRIEYEAKHVRTHVSFTSEILEIIKSYYFRPDKYQLLGIYQETSVIHL